MSRPRVCDVAILLGLAEKVAVKEALESVAATGSGIRMGAAGHEAFISSMALHFVDRVPFETLGLFRGIVPIQDSKMMVFFCLKPCACAVSFFQHKVGLFEPSIIFRGACDVSLRLMRCARRRRRCHSTRKGEKLCGDSM